MAGDFGFDCGNLIHAKIGTVTLTSGVSYNIENYFESLVSNNLSKSLMQSSTPGVSAILTLDTGASQRIGYLNAADIDSSLGQKIWSFESTLENATNWEELTATAASSGGSVSAGGSYTWVA
jgi:hypothetical protein